jgi:hypothetical protein
MSENFGSEIHVPIPVASNLLVGFGHIHQRQRQFLVEIRTEPIRDCCASQMGSKIEGQWHIDILQHTQGQETCKHRN